MSENIVPYANINGTVLKNDVVRPSKQYNYNDMSTDAISVFDFHNQTAGKWQTEASIMQIANKKLKSYSLSIHCLVDDEETELTFPDNGGDVGEDQAYMELKYETDEVVPQSGTIKLLYWKYYHINLYRDHNGQKFIQLFPVFYSESNYPNLFEGSIPKEFYTSQGGEDFDAIEPVTNPVYDEHNNPYPADTQGLNISLNNPFVFYDDETLNFGRMPVNLIRKSGRNVVISLDNVTTLWIDGEDTYICTHFKCLEFIPKWNASAEKFDNALQDPFLKFTFPRNTSGDNEHIEFINKFNVQKIKIISTTPDLTDPSAHVSIYLNVDFEGKTDIRHGAETVINRNAGITFNNVTVGSGFELETDSTNRMISINGKLTGSTTGLRIEGKSFSTTYIELNLNYPSYADVNDRTTHPILAAFNRINTSINPRTWEYEVMCDVTALTICSSMEHKEVDCYLTGLRYDCKNSYRDKQNNIVTEVYPGVQALVDDKLMGNPVLNVCGDLVCRITQEMPYDAELTYFNISIFDLLKRIQQLEQQNKEYADRLHALEIANVDVTSSDLESDSREAQRLNEIKIKYSNIYA